MLSGILEASRPKAKVQCRVTGLSPMKTSKDKSYFDGVHIDARVIHRAIHPRLYAYIIMIESALSSRAVDNSKSAPRSIPKRDRHT